MFCLEFSFIFSADGKFQLDFNNNSPLAKYLLKNDDVFLISEGVKLSASNGGLIPNGNMVLFINKIIRINYFETSRSKHLVVINLDLMKCSLICGSTRFQINQIWRNSQLLQNYIMGRIWQFSNSIFLMKSMSHQILSLKK